MEGHEMSKQWAVDTLAEAMRDFHRDHRPLFGDTGLNPVGWAHMADALRAAGWIVTTTDDDALAGADRFVGFDEQGKWHR